MFGSKTPIIVNVSRTISKGYQSKVAGFSFEVPKGVDLHDALDLADFMIEARLTGIYRSAMKDKHRATYAACFDGELADFLALVNQTRLKELEERKIRRNAGLPSENWHGQD